MRAEAHAVFDTIVSQLSQEGLSSPLFQVERHTVSAAFAENLIESCTPNSEQSQFWYQTSKTVWGSNSESDSGSDL